LATKTAFLEMTVFSARCRCKRHIAQCTNGYYYYYYYYTRFI